MVEEEKVGHMGLVEAGRASPGVDMAGGGEVVAEGIVLVVVVGVRSHLAEVVRASVRRIVAREVVPIAVDLVEGIGRVAAGRSSFDLTLIL